MTPERLRLTAYDRDGLSAVRTTLLDVYAEVYAKEITTDPFFSMERFEQRLSGHSSRSGWACVVGEVEGEIVGYAYGFRKPATYTYEGLRTSVHPDLLKEDGQRTFALCEIMVRAPWRGTEIAHTIHDRLMSSRPEQRASLLVDTTHPRVRARYEQWGYRWLGGIRTFDDGPLYDLMMLDLR